MKKRNTKQVILPLITSFIWGSSFVAQSLGAGKVGGFTFTAARSIPAVLVLGALVLILRRVRHEEKYTPQQKKDLLEGGLVCGIFLTLGTNLQQFGIADTTAGKAGFITALYIVLVPLGAVFLGRKIRRENWYGAALATCGLALLSLHGSLAVAWGDVVVFVCAFFWAAQILFIDRFAARVDAIELSVAQVFVCMVGSVVLAALFETVTLPAIAHSWLAIFYGGVMSAGVAFTLQIFGQKYAEPGPAAIIMSFESVFGALASWFFLDEVLTAQELCGCLLMFLGMTVTQAGLFRRRRRAA